MRRRDAISVAFGGLALLTSVLVIGGVLRWTQAIVAALVAAALATQMLARRKLDRTSPLIVLIGAAILLTALQLVPLPSSLLEFLDSTGSNLRSDGAAIADTHPWMSISLDPAETLRQLAFFITLMGVAVLSLRFATSERGRFALLGSVAVTCGITAAVTGVHTLVNADTLYGLYDPLYVHGGPVFGPLLNTNHMGGLMAIGTVLSVGLAFYHRQPTQLRVLWIVIGLGCAIVTAASLSRGAMIGLVIGVLVAGVLLVTSRLTSGTRRRRRLRDDLPVGIVVALGLAVALYMSAGSVVDQLDNTSLTELSQPTSKYAAWKDSLTLVKESPVVGIGRGATESTLTRVHPESARATFSHLENEYLSAVVEWGVLGALILGGILAWCFVAGIRRWRDGPLAAAALGALAMIMFQSCVDFGVELLGLAVPVTIIAATVQLVPLREAASLPILRVQRAALIVLLLAGAGVLLLPMTRSLREDHDLIVENGAPKLDEIRASIERHPLDYIAFGEAANVTWRAGDPKAIQYLNHALMLHPTHPGLHRLAARMLVSAHRYQQAALEYSLAMNAEPAPRRLLDEIVKALTDPADAAAAIPTDYPKLDVMLHSLSDINRDDISLKWLARVAQRPEHDVRVIDRLYALAMSRKDFDAAKAAAELRLKVARTTTSQLMLAKVRFQRKEFDVLLKDLANVANWTGRIDEKAQAWFILCDIHIEHRSWDVALECIHHLDGSGLLAGSRLEINKRLQYVKEQRTFESKMQAAEALEKSIKKPPPKP